ncbi:MAG: hypothetical protein OXC25_13860, partial [Thiotrichales bacterium]|nr:hypothetical protein [Thiotrichales bacterium]
NAAASRKRLNAPTLRTTAADQCGLAGLTGSEQKAGLARQHMRDPEMARHFGRGHLMTTSRSDAEYHDNRQ